MKNQLLLLTLITLVSGCSVQKQKVASSFGECVAAGNPVMESYPRQCRSENGQTFIEEAGEGAIGFCTYDAKVCPDGTSVGRVPPDCEFAPCPGE